MQVAVIHTEDFSAMHNLLKSSQWYNTYDLRTMEETFLYTDRDLMYPLIVIQQKGNDYITVMDPANDRNDQLQPFTVVY